MLLLLFCCIIVTAVILGIIYYLVRDDKDLNDITRLNPTRVSRVIKPTTIEEIQEAIKLHSGSICIGGGRYSMGGQTVFENGLHIDMRGMNKIIYLDVESKIITVQTGITWRDIQEVIDQHDLSIKIMQSYANFTVGGSLSVNVHGRYVNAGPLVNSVISLRMVMAEGQLLTASREENSEIFSAAIGGYGALGVIVEATLSLVDNEKLERIVTEIDVADYQSNFEKIREDTRAVLHNGDLYAPDLNRVRVETWYRTEKDVTIHEKLIPRDQRYWLQPNFISLIANLPFGQHLRRLIEPQLDIKELVTWRNHEASHDVAELEPMTPRWFWTYVLQEYFVPTDKFEVFIPKLRDVLQKHKVNIVNISIRHSPTDTESLLSWAQTDVFSFVLYYKQGTSLWDQIAVCLWTQELVDQVLSVGGTYYLPYQIHATKQQFQRAYPTYSKFFDLKRRVDSTNKFRNKMIDAYS